MATARIDSSAILSLIMARLEAQISVAVMVKRYPGEPLPVDSTLPWVHLFAVDETSIGRTIGPSDTSGGDVQDGQRIVAAMTIGVPDAATRASLFALPRAISRVRAALESVMLSDGVHHVRLFGFAASPDPMPDDSARIRTAGATVSGVAWRDSGSTISS